MPGECRGWRKSERGWAVQALIVGQGVRIGTNDVRMDERRTIAGAAMLGGAPESGIGDDRIGAVYFFEMEVGESGDQARDVAAGGLHFNRDGDGVLVILDAEDHRQTAVGSGIERLPEFAFARGAIAERDVGDFVTVELDILRSEE